LENFATEPTKFYQLDISFSILFYKEIVLAGNPKILNVVEPISPNSHILNSSIQKIPVGWTLVKKSVQPTGTILFNSISFFVVPMFKNHLTINYFLGSICFNKPIESIVNKLNNQPIE